MNKNARTADRDKAAKRREYVTPQLRAYGNVRSLTEGGSGATMEGMAMTSMIRFP